MPLRACLASFWTIVILALCWYPRSLMAIDESGPKLFNIPHLDKIVHMGIFAVFSFLWMWVGWSKFRAGRIVIAGVALTLLSEVVQELPIVNRDANLLDGVADISGVILGVAAFELGRRFAARRAVPLEV